MTTNANKLNVQREADNILSKYYKKKQPSTISNINQGRRVTSTPTLFSSYTSALANKHPTTNSPFNITRSNILNQKPVTISFSTNNVNQSTLGYSPSPYKFSSHNNSPKEHPPPSYNFSGQSNTSKYKQYIPNSNATDDSSNQSNKSLKKSTSDNNSVVTPSTVHLTKKVQTGKMNWIR